MEIDWTNLGEVALASFGIAVAVVVMFSLGVVAWSRLGTLRGGGPVGRRERVAGATAVLCFAACLAVAAYGIDAIVPG